MHPACRQGGGTRCRIYGKPKQAHERGAQIYDRTAERAKRLPAGGGRFGDGQFQRLMIEPPDQKAGRSRPNAGAVELKFKRQ